MPVRPSIQCSFTKSGGAVAAAWEGSKTSVVVEYARPEPQLVMPRTSRDVLLVGVLATLVAVAVTWPTAARFGSAARIDSGDGRFSVWNIAWVGHALTTDPAQLWNANIFAPNAGALTFSEPNLVAGLLGTPVWLATRNAYATANFVMFAAFVLAAMAMFMLARHVTGSAVSSVAVAILYAFCPYALAHIPQIQLLMTFGPPLGLLAMHRFTEIPSLGRATQLGAALAVQGLACGYYGIYGGWAVALGLGWFGALSGQWRQPRYWAMVFVAIAVMATIVSPFFWPYAELRGHGLDRDLAQARIFRAGWRSYLASPLIGHQWLLGLLSSWREVLFPGVLPIGLTALAIGQSLMAPAAVRPSRKVLTFYLLLAVLALWGSFGPDAGLYRLLYELPLTSLLRAPARLGLFVTLALSVAAALGIATLDRTLDGAYRRVVLGGLVICAILARSSVGGLNLVAAPPAVRAYTWLSALPRGIVAEFPFFSGRERHRQTEYMLMSVRHWQPLINGYSDYMPEDAVAAMTALSSFPSTESIGALRIRQARYVTVHWGLYPPDDAERIHAWLRQSNDLISLLDATDVSLYQLAPARTDGNAPRQPLRSASLPR